MMPMMWRQREAQRLQNIGGGTDAHLRRGLAVSGVFADDSRKLDWPSRRNYPSDCLFTEYQCSLETWLRCYDDRSADGEEVVEAAGHRNAGYIAVKGDNPEISGAQELD